MRAALPDDFLRLPLAHRALHDAGPTRLPRSDSSRAPPVQLSPVLDARRAVGGGFAYRPAERIAAARDFARKTATNHSAMTRTMVGAGALSMKNAA